MTKIEIEDGITGFCITHGDEKYFLTSPDSLIRQVKSIFGVTKGKKRIELSKEQVQAPQPLFLDIFSPFPRDDVCPEDPVVTIPEEPEEPEESEELTPATPLVPLDIPSEQPDNTLDQEPIPIFKELDRVSKRQLTKRIGINAMLSYHDQPDGKLVINYGSSKLYTSWEDMLKLPVFVDSESLLGLNPSKQTAVKHFRRWIRMNPSKIPASLKKDPGLDLDDIYRPCLSGVLNTSTDYDGGKVEGDLSD